MKIILLKDVAKLGRKFDTKEVSSGYALNLLIPKGLAVAATADAVKKISLMKAEIEGERKLRADLELKNIKDLENVSLQIFGKANEKGHLFAGLHNAEIVDELQKQTGLQISPDSLNMPHPIKATGEHLVEVNGAGKTIKFKVVVSASK